MYYLFSELTPDAEATVTSPGFGTGLDISSNALATITFNASGSPTNLAIGQVFRVAQYKRSGWQVNNGSGIEIGVTSSIAIETTTHVSSVVVGDRIYKIASNAMVEVGTVKAVVVSGTTTITFDGPGTLTTLVDDEKLYVLKSDNGTVRVTNATATSYACSIVNSGSGYTNITNETVGTDDTAAGDGTFLEFIYVQNKIVPNIVDKENSESQFRSSVWTDVQGNYINTGSITLRTGATNNINNISQVGLNAILVKRITVKVTTAIACTAACKGIAIFKSSTDGLDETDANDRGTLLVSNSLIGNAVATYIIDMDPYDANNSIVSGSYLKVSAVDSNDVIQTANVNLTGGVVKIFIDYVTYDGTIYA